MAFDMIDIIDAKNGDNILILILAIIYLIIQKYLYNLWQKRDRKKRRSLWISVLRKNDIIDECLLKFENIRYMGGFYSTIAMMIGMIFGGLLTFKLFVYVQNQTSNMGFAGASLSLINLIPYLILIITLSSIKKESANLKKINLAKYYFIGINWFIFITNIFIIIFFIFNILNLDKFDEPQLNGLLIIYGLTVPILASVVFFSRMSEQKFYNNIKSSLNELYLDKFPYLEITVKEEKLNGNLEDIFNENLIVLNKNGLKVVVEWDSIYSLKFYEKVIQNDLSLYY